MIYYKVVLDDDLVGVCTSNDLRKHQKKHNILVFASPETAQCIDLRGVLYRDGWMQKQTAEDYPAIQASVTAIMEEEYNAVLTAESTEIPEQIMEFLTNEEMTDAEQEAYDEEYSEVSVAYIREMKLKELKTACGNAISKGFDLEVAGEKRHFSMTATDQLNLQSASFQILSGDSVIPYHSDGDEYREYTADDMLKIVTAANEHKAYHLAYLNSLKKWIHALRKISTISAVEYGSEIPAKYQSAYLKSLVEV